MKIRCAITMGDPSGIGPEIIIKALRDPVLRGLAEFVVIGDVKVIKRTHNLELITHNSKFIDVHNVSQDNFRFGKIKAEYGKASLEYLQKALELIKAKKIDCLVTAPVSKEAIHLAGNKFSGQTEYIAKAFKIKDVVMMLFNQKIRVSLVTRHIPLKEVATRIKSQEIFKTISGTASGLNSFFRIKKPRLVVCGLNPHASDNGVIGDEEKQEIIPAIKKAKQKGFLVSGPYPADTLFEKAVKGAYDGVVCMYHDQGLIPLKLTGFFDAVNISVGLPFVRTSPGHGTAFDIAGKDKANPNAFIAAVKAAIQCSQNLKKA